MSSLSAPPPKLGAKVQSFSPGNIEKGVLLFVSWAVSTAAQSRLARSLQITESSATWPSPECAFLPTWGTVSSSESELESVSSFFLFKIFFSIFPSLVALSNWASQKSHFPYDSGRIRGRPGNLVISTEKTFGKRDSNMNICDAGVGARTFFIDSSPSNLP